MKDPEKRSSYRLGENICKPYTWQRLLIIYKEPQKSIVNVSKDADSLIRKCTKTQRHISPKKICKWQISTWKEIESKVAQLCLTLCKPMDYSLQRSSIHGIFQARVLEWVAISFSTLPTRYMQIKTTVSYHSLPFKWTKIKNSDIFIW